MNWPTQSRMITVYGSGWQLYVNEVLGLVEMGGGKAGLVDDDCVHRAWLDLLTPEEAAINELVAQGVIDNSLEPLSECGGWQDCNEA